MADLKLIVGIGNPGRRYARTRHNVGWRICDRLADRYGMSGPRARFDGLVQEGRIGEVRAVLLKPTTYVNESGRSVAKAVQWYDLEMADLLVCCDDINLPLGRLRVRRRGSSGGHGGLASIIEQLGTEAFPRLRVGVGRSGPASQVDHVLGRFRRSERRAAEEAIEHAADALMAWAVRGIEACMNEFN